MLDQSRTGSTSRFWRNLVSFLVGFALVSLNVAFAAKPDRVSGAGEDAAPVVVLDFWAPWCAPCLDVNERLDELAEEMPGQFEIVRVNVDEEPQVARQFDVESLPTVIVIQEQNILGRFRGGRSKAEIRAFLKNLLPRNPYAFLGPTATT